ncbi:hypothetical protein M422DRAFT_240782 [Sphaerobolus stellatus SS14]|nr:hypothetical protein M422DRAFT_240782 [Sphaerobolus stellatus SS14]
MSSAVATAARIRGLTSLLGHAPIRIGAAAAFSTSSPVFAGNPPCYTGRAPILIPPNVVLRQTQDAIEVTGPLGTTRVPLEPYMSLTYKSYEPGAPAAEVVAPPEHAAGKGKEKNIPPPSIFITVEKPTARKQRSMWGLTRTLIANAITGMTEGFTVPLHLVGVGYRAALETDPRPMRVIERQGGGLSNDGKGPPLRLNMKLGYSHSVFVPVPPHIKAEVPAPTRIMLFGTDKQKLGAFAAQVRGWRKPEPYKGKGIFVGSEVIRLKSVKKK